jgi:hypothetical protein
MIEYLTNLAEAVNRLNVEERALWNKIIGSMGDLKLVRKSEAVKAAGPDTINKIDD